MPVYRRQVEITYTTPRAEETRRSIEGLATTADEAARRIVSAGTTAARGLDEVGRSAIKNQSQFGDFVKSATASADAMSAALGRLDRDFDSLRLSLDPAARALRDFEAAQETARRAVQFGSATQEEATRVVALAAQRYQAATAGLVRESGQAAVMSRRMGAAVQQAGFQVGDFAVQVASGQSPLRAFIQQGTQLVSMFGPWGAAVGAAGAVVGALAVALWDSEDAIKGADDATRTYAESLAAVDQIVRELNQSTKTRTELQREQNQAALEGAQAELALARARLESARLAAAGGVGEAGAFEIGQVEGFENAVATAEQKLAELEKKLADAMKSVADAKASEALNATLQSADRLVRSLSPLIDAEMTLAEQEELLKLAVDNGRISRDLYNASMAKAHERYLEAVDPLSAILNGYARERQLLALSNEERAVQVELERRVNELRTAGVEVTLQVTQALEEEIRTTERARQASKAAGEAAKQFGEDASGAAEEAERAWRDVIDRIAGFSEEALGDSFFDLLKGETLDFAEFFETTILRALANVLAAAATQQLVIPIAMQAAGAAPGLFGLGGDAAAVAQARAGGGLFGGGGIPNPFSLFGSGVQGIGTNYALGGIPGVLFGAPGGTAAGLGVAAVPGGVTNAATAGLFGTGGSLTAAGALGLVGAALGAIALFSSVLGGNPSVGPVGIADFSPGLGRRRAFDVPGIDPFTADNGGDAEALRPIAEAIADLIAESADRFSATIAQDLRFRVANYASPESGSGRVAGFEVNAFVRGEAERRVAEGLSQEQALFEALQFAVKEAFTFDSATLAEAAANVAATTTEELLGRLEFADNFDRMVVALDELGRGIDASTLAIAQNTVAVQNAAREFVDQAAGPIAEALRTALELFPAETTRRDRGPRSVRSVIVGTVGEDERYLNPGDDGYDAAAAAPGARIIDRIVRLDEEVTERAANYAANLERIRDATAIATGSVDQLIQQITGEFEPEIRGPFTDALAAGNARLEALRQHIEDVNEEIAAANEAFPELDAALVDTLNVLQEASQVLVQQLQQDYADAIQRQLNAATGLGAVNVIADLLDARDANLADAIALGLSGDGADKLFDAQLRQALGGASLADLNAILVSGQIVDEGARAIVELILQEQALAFTRQEQAAGLAALQQQSAAFAAAANDNARRLRQAAAGLLVDPNLSPLSPLERLNEARRQFDAAVDLANDADPEDEASQDAIQRLPDLSQTLLEAARAYYASSEGYAQEFARVQSALASTATRQESIEQQQLAVLRSIEQQIAALGAAAGTPADRAALGGFDFGRNPERNRQIYNTLAAAGLPTPSGFGSGQLNALRAQNPAVHAILLAMGFNQGGMVPLNLGTPGRDSVLVATTPGERVLSVEQSRMFERLAANANGQSVVAAIDRLTGRVDRLIALSADSGEATMAGLTAVADGVNEVRQQLRRVG